tara:strand:+ start:39190 stop:40893 length:1704 start_codon:yes stop_codon:yes gene_type:complete
MKILSIYPYTHISSAALMINGKIEAAISEERLNRIKMSTLFPLKSINWCLKKCKVKLKDIDLIVVPWNPSHNINTASSRWINDLRWRGEMLTNIPIHIMKILDEEPSPFMSIEFNKKKIVYLNHHECHAASAFYTSPFKRCDILTIDGHGEVDSCFFGTGVNKLISEKDTIKYPHSVGLFYGAFTNFLGFKPDSDEWKAMALSSYKFKEKNDFLRKAEKLFILQDGKFELDLSYFDYYLFDKKKYFFNSKFKKLFGEPRKKNEKIKKHHYKIASAMQYSFEKIVFYLLKNLKKRGSKSNNLVLAGGAAMNCVFNGLLNKKKIYKNVYIPAYPDDTGVSIGAAYLANYKFNKKIKRKIYHEKHNYFGPSYSNNEVLTELKKSKLSFINPKDLEKYIAIKISEGKLVGWFQGSMEFSHRALGNRSILADPRNPKMKDILNRAIKFREGFRPFAPSVLEEEASKIFELNKKDRVYFMEKTAIVRTNWRKKIPAVTHVDNTARVQTVSKKINPKFYKLIQEFKKITGVPILVNTSFNLNGEPIVCDPNDAIRTFFSCGLDLLVIGDYVVSK